MSFQINNDNFLLIFMTNRRLKVFVCKRIKRSRYRKLATFFNGLAYKNLRSFVLHI